MAIARTLSSARLAIAAKDANETPNAVRPRNITRLRPQTSLLRPQKPLENHQIAAEATKGSEP